MPNNIVDQIHEMVNKGAEREADKLRAHLVDAHKTIGELSARIKELEEAATKPSGESQRQVEQAMAAVKVHSVRARQAILDGEAARNQVILLNRELVALRKELEEVKTRKAKEVAEFVAANPVAPQLATKVRRSQRRLSPRIKSEDTDRE